MAEAAGTSHHVELNGLRFHYVAWGSPDLPLLICLHGLRSYGRTFAGLAASLDDRFHVLALDQRGRGESDWDPARHYFTPTYVADLEALVRHLGVARFHLLGHSMGGMNALLYAQRNPGRLLSLILEDSGPEAQEGLSSGLQRILAELERTPLSFPDFAAARAFWRSIRPDVTEEAIQSRTANSMVEKDGRIVWRHDQEGIAACRIAQARAQDRLDLWPAVDAIDCPTLVLRGARSDYLDTDRVAQMCRRNPRILAEDIFGAGHYVHDDNPVAFNRAVGDFLAPSP
ncbi:MAG: alpha/beta hydrolase [Pseudomonadota bacterium]